MVGAFYLIASNTSKVLAVINTSIIELLIFSATVDHWNLLGENGEKKDNVTSFVYF